MLQAAEAGRGKKNTKTIRSAALAEMVAISSSPLDEVNVF